MKYPIDVEVHLKAVCLNQESDASTENFVRRYVSLINGAYYDGKSGRGAYPMDPKAEIARRSQELGISTVEDVVAEMLSIIIHWMNDAYAQGVQDAETEAA